MLQDDYGGNNPVINSQGDNLGNNHRKEREKVYVSAARSSNGILVRPTPAQEATTGREKRAKENPQIQ
jgi:hypothetical protein